jgi:hypothetical protein
MVSEMSKSILTTDAIKVEALKILNDEFKRSYMTTEEIAAEVREMLLDRLRTKRKWDATQHNNHT